ncbi:MAG: glycosyltransferase family 2 protein [Egibacteraceae bacterium]
MVIGDETVGEFGRDTNSGRLVGRLHARRASLDSVAVARVRVAPATRDGRLEFVVTAHNSAATVEACVRSLLALRRTWRVTVVNDASRDETGTVLARIDDPRVRVMTVGYRSRAKASNTGFRQAEAEYVCSVDADVRYMEDRFDDLLPLLDRFPLLMLTNDPADAQACEVRLGAGFMAPRNSFVFSRRQLPELAFAEVYPKTGGEDTDLALRLLKAGVALGAVYGGYMHARVEGRMGLRRRVHFHLWNVITYLRHLEVPMCRERLTEIARHPLRRLAASLRQEYGRGRAES